MQSKNIVVPGAIGAIIPLIIGLISEEGLRALISAITNDAIGAATSAGWDSILITVLAGVCAAVGSGVIAYYKQISASGDNLEETTPQASARGTFVQADESKKPISAFWTGA